MKRILITGGPVHAHLDAVKLITNRFKGGLMCELAEALLAFDAEIVYLCAPKVGAQLPAAHNRISIVRHNGFEDYRAKVMELAPTMDAVVLGAAVANLIPVKPFAGKFPSHNFKPGDIIPIDFTIAPRVIDEVKSAAPNTHLFGFKLLSGVSHEELIQAAYSIVMEARATAVFANDEKNLKQKYAVTKERGVHPLRQEDLAAWIWQMLSDAYYSSVGVPELPLPKLELARFKALIEHYQPHFVQTEDGFVFGTAAIRFGSGFLTTSRGKRELDSFVYVAGVDHIRREVVISSRTKATLNAPLLARMFENPAVDSIVHYHEQVSGMPSYPYAPPGSVRDSERLNSTSFNIQEHGCVLLFDREGRQL